MTVITFIGIAGILMASATIYLIREPLFLIVAGLILVTSICLLFSSEPQIQGNSEMEICRSIGSSYGAVGESWNGEENITIYGCLKR